MVNAIHGYGVGKSRFLIITTTVSCVDHGKVEPKAPTQHQHRYATARPKEERASAGAPCRE